MSGVWRLLRSLKLRVLGPAKEYVGADPQGNKYYRVPKHETWAGEGREGGGASRSEGQTRVMFTSRALSSETSPKVFAYPKFPLAELE